MDSSRSRFIGWLALAFVLCTCGVDSAFADGKFFHELKVTDEPGIQAQRAVVVYKDGTETLIVQSDVAGVGTSYGWLLPLPAEPTSVAPCHASSLHALGNVMEPETAEHSPTFVLLSFAVMLIVVAICLDHLRCKATPNTRISPVNVVLLLLLVVLLLVSFMLPTLVGEGGLPEEVSVLQTIKAGVYDVAIIKGKTAEAVETWLKSNGFASPPSATKVIQEYVADGWCFLAAKVSAEANGTATHHPLKVTFPAAKAVYPMKLTGSDGEPVQLDLFVVADRRAVVGGMKTWACDIFNQDKAYSPTFSAFACELPPIYRGRETPSFVVGIPAVSEMMWDGCVVTRLHGRLEADDMRDDLHLTWTEAKPMRATFYSPADAVRLSATIAMIVVTLLFIGFTLRAVKRQWSWRMLLRRRLAAAVVLGLLAGGGRYLTLDTGHVESTNEHKMWPLMSVRAHASALERLTNEPPGASFPEAYRNMLQESWLFRDLDGKEDMNRPGDFKIEAIDDGWRLTIIDRQQIPVTIPISSDGRPQLAGKRNS